MIPQINPSQFQAWVATQSAPVTLLDVREGWEVQTASVTADGFVIKHIPMNDTPARLAERSQHVAQFLLQNEFTNVINIAGGIAAWAQTVDHSIPQY
jgi:rhodanese-related sulfurtransferase